MNDPLRDYFDARRQALTEHDRAVQAENRARGNLVGWGLLFALAMVVLCWGPFTIGVVRHDARLALLPVALFVLALIGLVAYGRWRR